MDWSSSLRFPSEDVCDSLVCDGIHVTKDHVNTGTIWSLNCVLFADTVAEMYGLMKNKKHKCKSICSFRVQRYKKRHILLLFCLDYTPAFIYLFIF